MPRIHAADAVLVAVVLAEVTSSLLLRALLVLWPLWVAFALVATGNHFWLDIAAGAALAAVTLVTTRVVRRSAARVAADAATPGRGQRFTHAAAARCRRPSAA